MQRKEPQANAVFGNRNQGPLLDLLLNLCKDLEKEVGDIRPPKTLTA